jgi:hypothetical protein
VRDHDRLHGRYGVSDTIVPGRAGLPGQRHHLDQQYLVGMSANPMIIRPVTIVGNGARLERVGGLNIRAFVVGSVPGGTTVPSDGTDVYDGTGSLTIQNLHVKGFRAKGGNGTNGGGGGLGAGGAVYTTQHW